MLKLIAFVFLFSGITVSAQSPKIYEGYFVHDKSLLPSVALRPELVIDHVTNEGFEVYGPKGLGPWLNRNFINSFSIQPMRDLSLYLTPEEFEKQLIAFVRQYPQIAKIESIGKSTLGRDLWVVKITKNIQQDSQKPEFKYIANMHGNEIVGREVMMLFIKDLLSGYGPNDQLTRLIDELQIYILPSMNPDGAAAGVRYNAENYDLNRDFPEWSRGDQNTVDGRAKETQLLMAWEKNHHFVLSANFHCGVEVVNYPWDGVEERHPLNTELKAMSLKYAEKVPYLYHSTRFENGITNGWDWFPVLGGMQDWSYYFHNDLQITVELSDDPWPNPMLIPGFYQANKTAIIEFMENALRL